MAALDRYNDRGDSPDNGQGVHSWVMSKATLGLMAGLPPEQIRSDLWRTIPKNRKNPDKEISDAIQKAIQDHNGGTFTPRPRPRPIVRDGRATLQRIIDQRKIGDEVELWESSPIRLMDEPRHDTILLLETLYEPTDLIWIGEHDQPGIVGDTIRTAAEWISYLRLGGKTAPHVIPNPLTGTPALTKTGDKTTLRGDACVRSYRFCVVEFDNLSRTDQIKFWSAVKLPVVCLIDSGGKSIHGWVDVQKLAKIETPEDWEQEIKVNLYDRLLSPLGVDKACSNPARLSRLPGHYRTEKGKYQRLLWLSPKGRSIC